MYATLKMTFAIQKDGETLPDLQKKKWSPSTTSLAKATSTDTDIYILTLTSTQQPESTIQLKKLMQCLIKGGALIIL